MSIETAKPDLNYLKKATQLSWRVIEIIAVSCFGIMFIVMLLQVFSRYVFKIGLPWTDEAARFLFLWSTFIGAAIAQRFNAHIRVTILVDRLSEKVKNVFLIVADLSSVIIAVIIFYGTILMMKKTFGVLASSIPISYTWIYLSLALGTFIIIMLLTSNIFKRFM